MNEHASPIGEDDAARKRAARWRLSTGEDLEQALTAAERLFAESSSEARHLEDRSFNFASLAVVVFLSLAASLFAIFDWGSAPVAALAISAMSALLSLTLLKYAANRRRLKDVTTLNIASDIASLVSESVAEVADREKWSELRVQTFRLRLSAFPMRVNRKRPW